MSEGEDDIPLVDSRPTVRLDPTDLKPSWPVMIAMLDQLGAWLPFALRLGVLALINNCVRELAEPTASPETIVRLRELVEMLAHLPLER